MTNGRWLSVDEIAARPVLSAGGGFAVTERRTVLWAVQEDNEASDEAKENGASAVLQKVEARRRRHDETN